MKSSAIPLVSVIIAAYNEERYIKRCIASILDQTFTNIEVIVIDDGSNDNTLNILRSFSDKRLKIYSQENKGRVFSRNKALYLARGKYVILQDADDWSDRRRINLQLNIAEQIDGKPVVGCNYIIIKQDKKKKIFKKFPETNTEIRRKMSRYFMSQSFLPSSILLLRKHLIALEGWRSKFDIACEDGDLLDRIFEDKSSILHNVQEHLYYYRINDGSVTNKIDLTIPYQIFKRDCKIRRRSNKKEFVNINEFLLHTRSNIFRKIIYELSYFGFMMAKRIRNTN